MADELLRLYAERKLVRGHAFPPDAPWQHEFEDAFPYDLTVDQATAIEDVKKDMETPTPMDRLIIGDVGYGKTEVAMRAAFKAVMDGKQVAVLTPTTVLAYQHFETFQETLCGVSGEDRTAVALSVARRNKRLSSKRPSKGEVDVLIGTHRILSNDVKLPKLGLVVVDEEQRFGVAHKEKLKQLKKKVDVLTLSATPIPRTLNMSLLGMRDMSVIETPPRDRLAINTQVVQFSEGVIRSAIELELARNGQIFFIHNRVETIEAIAALVQKIVPERAHRDRPRADERKGDGAGDARFHRLQIRRSRRDDDHRERHRHPACEHDHHQPRRQLRPFAALSASRARRPFEPPGLCISVDTERA